MESSDLGCPNIRARMEMMTMFTKLVYRFHPDFIAVMGRCIAGIMQNSPETGVLL